MFELIVLCNLGLTVVGFPTIERPWFGPLTPIEEAMQRQPEIAMLQMTPGRGKRAQPGDRLTLQIVVRKPQGRVLADSNRRGLPWTMTIAEGDKMSDLFWGMAKGERRLVAVPNGFLREALSGVIIEAEAIQVVRPEVALHRQPKR